MKKNRLYYSASLAGLATILYYTLAIFLRAIISAILHINLPGAGLSNPAGVSEVLIATLNAVCKIINLAIPIYVVLKFSPSHGLPFSLKKINRKYYLYFLPLVLFAATITSAFSGVLKSSLEKIGATSPEAMNLPDSHFAILITFISICVIPAIGEEILFRGAIQGILRSGGQWFSIITSSLLFTLLHSDLSQFPSIFLLSVFLGYAAAYTGSIRISIAMHFANNSLSFLLLLCREYMDATSVLGFSVLLFTVYISCGITALAYIYKNKYNLKLHRHYHKKGSVPSIVIVSKVPVFVGAVLLLLTLTITGYF